MKILLVSHAFYPGVGGIETVSMMLAKAFVESGHEVVVVTHVQDSGDDDSFAFRIVRRPASLQLISLTRWADVMFHNNISLQAAWPLLLVRRPWVVAHHTWMPTGGGLRGLKGRMKQMALRFSRGISVSQAIAAHASTPSVVIPNPYDDERFRILPEIERNKDLVFVGRLVSDKGADLLLHSLKRLKDDKGVQPSLTIAGDGPELQPLKDLAERLGLAQNVNFSGRVVGDELVALLNAHKIMVVPSRWNEPFGVVALEGIACGCTVVGSSGGGLSDAIGPCGLTFTNNDENSLTSCLARLLAEPALIESLAANAVEHLAKHKQRQVASEYLRVLEQAVSEG